MGKEIRIKKASGETAVFSEKKLAASLTKAGANAEQCQNILQEINGKIYNGISTREIYRLAFDLLKEESRHLAARYHLKRAIMELGPSGFPFEKFIAEIFKKQQYHVSTGEIIPGKCVRHEIDVVASTSALKLLIECKYHSQQGIFCDVKIPLYIHARFNDIANAMGDHSHQPSQGWIVTNTRFSLDALQYGTCAGLKLMGWDYPATDGLKTRIDALGLYPVTCLTSLSEEEKKALLDNQHVLCSELRSNPDLLKHIKIKPARIEVVLREVNLLCTQIDQELHFHQPRC